MNIRHFFHLDFNKSFFYSLSLTLEIIFQGKMDLEIRRSI